MTDSLATQVATAMLHNDHATVALGMRILKVSEDACTIEMEVRKDMLNGHGTCHGSFLFALADSAFAFACNSRNEHTVAAGADIDFLRPARHGDLLCATAIERSAGRWLGLYDVAVTNQDQEIVARFHGRCCRIEGTILDGPLNGGR